MSNSNHGIPEIPQEYLNGCKLVTNRYELIKKIAVKNKIVTEIGVAFGDFSQYLINVLKPKKFIAIDTFDLHDIESVWGISTKDKFEGLTHIEWYKKRFEKYIKKNQFEIKRGFSWEAILDFPDNYFDIVYLDAEHTYESVKNDLSAIKSKIKRKGILILNDYTLYDPYLKVPYGVIKAANEFIIHHKCKVIFFAFERNMFCDMAIRV